MIFTVLVALATLASAAASCGGTFTGTTGEFTSPNYPSDYPTGVSCVYEIEVLPFHIITLTITDLDIQFCYGCSCDYVKVDDGDMMCGTASIGKTFTSEKNMLVTFHSDHSTSMKGFEARYSQVPNAENVTAAPTTAAPTTAAPTTAESSTTAEPNDGTAAADIYSCAAFGRCCKGNDSDCGPDEHYCNCDEGCHMFDDCCWDYDAYCNIESSEPECSSDFEVVGGKCVRWLGLRAKYAVAQTKCADLGASVLMLKSESFTDAIMAWDKVTKKNFWVGLDNEDAPEGKEKDFTWADGTALVDGDWVNWKYAPRNGPGHMNKCVGSGADHQEWRRYKCDVKSLYVICQEEEDDGN